MEFWGIELKPKQTITVKPGDDHFIHLSQAALGEEPTNDDHATIYVNLDGQKIAIGTLSSRTRMFQFDLVFEGPYEFSNSSMENSVYLSGSLVEKAGDKQEDEGTTENEGKKRELGDVSQMPAKKASPAGDKGDAKFSKRALKNEGKKRELGDVSQMPAKKARAAGDKGDAKFSKRALKNKGNETLEKAPGSVLMSSLEPGPSRNFKTFTPFE